MGTRKVQKGPVRGRRLAVAPGEGRAPLGEGAALGFADTAVALKLRQAMSDERGAARALAEFMLRHPVRTAALRIDELAEASGVSAPSISRFARALGFDGFAALRGDIAESVQAVLGPVAKLRGAVEAGAAAGAARAAYDRAGAHVATVETGAATAERLAALVERMLAARAVYLMGFGRSAHLAGLLALDLQPFCANLVNVVEYGGTEVAAGRLMNIARGDLLLVIAFPRYARAAPQLAAYARERGARVVALTDSPASPLAPLADDLLLAPADHAVLPSSLVAAMAIIEALISGLMVSRRQHVAQAARLSDAIADHLMPTAAPARARGR